MYKLIITEKPSVAGMIAEVLGVKEKKDGYLKGNEYLISWCIGHLVELAAPGDYQDEWKKWKPETLPVFPKEWMYVVKEGTKKQYRVLKELMHRQDVEEIICATDAGREGELIFRLVYETAGCRKPVKRLWISSMEDAAIRRGFEELRPGTEFDPLYHSALCRSQADWLVGINVTRLFSTLYHQKLPVGRVQTPTLALLVKREKEISEFEKEKYYVVHILGDGLDAVSEKINEQDMAEQIAGACQDGQAFVVSLMKEEKKMAAPRLYDLTTLQREANRLLGYTAQQTLDYAQSLYEKKLLTYPRSDSRFLTEDMEETAEDIFYAVIETFPDMPVVTYIPEIRRIINSRKVSDHHAIIPTIEVTTYNLTRVPDSEMKLLRMVANRMLSATEPEHHYESVKAELECNGNLFHVSGKKILDDGWKEIEEHFKKGIRYEEEDEGDIGEVPDLLEGSCIRIGGTKVSEHFTSPPKHYTEDTLLRAMEMAGSKEKDTDRKGLGTPATRAAIIEKLVRSGLAERNRKQMLPTENGKKLISVLPDVVKSPELTAEWEHELSKIAKGEQDTDAFMQGIMDMVSELIRDCQKADDHVFEKSREAIGRCPKCGNEVYESSRSFYCGNHQCGFSLFKDNKYFASMRKELSKKIAEKLLADGCVEVSGLYSKKNDSLFTAVIHMDVSGKYPRFSMEYVSGDKKNKKRG